ncbi:MAG: adenylyltransferase/cytidyltransferase family protein, partial [Actinobacteria bacterium]|nr:adenylyltransferase/cytidyltransferase family protein [Actinomycetota bacterium]MTA72983.1 adenylyltransferase/cytidyltransferase family protein [Actinomycetota bacterium]
MSVVVIGVFDGVHKGHQDVLNRAKALAGDEKIIALTFDPHPASIFAPDRAPTMLTILTDRIELLKIHNADQVAVIKFTSEFATMSPEDFVNKILIEQLHASTVIVGANFTYGHKAAGNVTTLAAHTEFETIALDLTPNDGEVVSST